MSIESLEHEVTSLRRHVARLEETIAIAKSRLRGLQKVERKLSLLCDRHPLAVVEWNRRLEIVGWNASAEQLFGYSREEAIGAQVEALLGASMVQEGWIGTGEHQTRDTQTIFCEWYFTPITDPEGNSAGMVAMGRLTNPNSSELFRPSNPTSEAAANSFAAETTPDPSEPQPEIPSNSSNSARSLRDRLPEQALLQKVWDGVDYGISVLDVLEQGREFRYVQMNPVMEQVYAMPAETLIGRTPAEVLPTEVAAKFYQCYRACVETGHTQVMEQNNDLDEADRCWQLTVTPLRDSSGENASNHPRIPHLVVTATDITERKHAEARLERTQKFLESVLENLPVAVMAKDAEELRYRLWNPAAERVMGFAAAEAVGMTDYDLLPREEASFLTSKDREALNARTALVIPEKEMSMGDGDRHILHIQKTPIVDATGKPEYVLDIVDDITEQQTALRDRRRAEAETLQKEAQYRGIFEAVTDGIAIFDLETGRMVEANPAICEMHGCTRDEFLRASVTDYIHPDSRDVLSGFFDTVRSGKMFQAQIVNFRQNGTPIDLEVRGIRFLYNGEPHGLSVVRDLSDRKRAEKEQERLIAILEATTDMVSMTNAEGFVTYLNRAGQQMLEVSSGEDLSTYHLNRFRAESASETMLEAISMALQEGVWSGENLLRSLGGREIPVLQVIMVHRSEQGDVEFFSTIARDITQRKQAEHALQRSEARLRQKADELEDALRDLQRTQSQLVQSEKMSSLGQLVAGVAHEINNPVNFIYGNLNHAEGYIQDLTQLLELYKQHYPSPHPDIQAEIRTIDLEFLMSDLPKLLSSMRVGAERIQKIVASLRTFSRMDEAEFKAVNIHDGIDSTLMILQNRLKPKHVRREQREYQRPEIEIVRSYGNLPQVECYAGQLNQVFMNILSNAIDAIDEGFDQTETAESPIIRIHTYLSSSQQVIIRIADNGPGMPEPVRQRLFDPFFTTKPVGKGTGMGLSISYQVVTERHGGMLHCVSAPGQGAEFVIQIPLKQRARIAAAVGNEGAGETGESAAN